MRQRIQNKIRITVEGEAMTTVTAIEFYIKQGNFFYQCTPEVVDDSTFLVTIPKEIAVALSTQKARLQFAYTDAAGDPQASDVLEVSVGELLKAGGYDGT